MVVISFIMRNIKHKLREFWAFCISNRWAFTLFGNCQCSLEISHPFLGRKVYHLKDDKSWGFFDERISFCKKVVIFTYGTWVIMFIPVPSASTLEPIKHTTKIVFIPIFNNELSFFIDIFLYISIKSQKNISCLDRFNSLMRTFHFRLSKIYFSLKWN